MRFRFLLTMGVTAAWMLGGFCQPASAIIISALTSANTLVTFDSATPGSIQSSVAISGLTAGDALVGIDYRPLDGVLVGFGYNSAAGTARVYSISATGSATSINTNTLTIGTGLTRITADFNPTANALRVVTSAAAANNLRIGSGGTATLTTDTATTLYEINGATNQLVTQGSVDFFTGSGTSPNSGTLTTVATLSGVTGPTIVGFDIANAPGTAATSPGTAFLATSSALFSLDLTNGSTSSLGNIGAGLTILDIAAVPEPSSLAFASIAIVGLVAGYRRKKRNAISADR
jgi:trimeric autotransporter adhesin